MNAPLHPEHLRALLAMTAAPEHDPDPAESAEWREAFLALVEAHGPERARFMLDEMARIARHKQIGWQPELSTPYVNTIAVESQPAFPGDLAIEERLGSLMRWNALAMVVRANQAYGELGGHIASYASAADLFEVGFNHFFHARDDQHRGDLVFFQPHSAPGVYARAYLEGRLSEQDLQHYRQEIEVLVVASMEEMVEAHLEQIGRARIAGDVAAQLAIRLVGAHHHRQRVPAHEGTQALLDREVAGEGGLRLDRDRVDVRGVELGLPADLLLPCHARQFTQHEARTLGAMRLHQRQEGLAPFRAFGGVDVVMVRRCGGHGQQGTQVLGMQWGVHIAAL